MVFSELIGNKLVKRRLSMLLKTNQLPHALFFHGVRGVGKRYAATLFAKAILPESGASHPDVRLLKPTGTGGMYEMAQIQELLAWANFTPWQSRYKIAILEEAHAMAACGSNALLKTLEEPLPHMFFILISDQALLPTLLARCQKISFCPLSHEEISQLQGGASPEAYAQSRGSLFYLQLVQSKAYVSISASIAALLDPSIIEDYPYFLDLCGSIEEQLASLTEQADSALIATEALWQAILYQSQKIASQHDPWFVQEQLDSADLASKRHIKIKTIMQAFFLKYHHQISYSSNTFRK